MPKKDADIIAVIEECDNDPFLAVWEYGKGRSLEHQQSTALITVRPLEFLNWKHTGMLYATW